MKKYFLLNLSPFLNDGKDIACMDEKGFLPCRFILFCSVIKKSSQTFIISARKVVMMRRSAKSVGLETGDEQVRLHKELPALLMPVPSAPATLDHDRNRRLTPISIHFVEGQVLNRTD